MSEKHKDEGTEAGFAEGIWVGVTGLILAVVLLHGLFLTVAALGRAWRGY